MNDHPALILLMTVIGAYVLHIWRDDYRAALNGNPNPGKLPGATPTTARACLIAVAGALVILALETWGEIHLGLSEEQSTITVLFGLYTLMAAFMEELIFRGFIVVDNRGKFVQWMSIVGASVVFAALHPFLWEWKDEGFIWTFNAKGWFSTAIVFLSSLWFYAVRFASFNPNHSLIPCIAAHAAKNLGVFAIKGIQGFVVGW
jgi:membrane protease YdiL (CAAX protease family)